MRPQKGDRLSGNLKAKDIADLLDLLAEYRARKRGGVGSTITDDSPDSRFVINSTGSPLQIGDVVAISEARDFANNENEAKTSMVLRGVTPTATTVDDVSYGITLQPTIDKQLGQVAFGGVCYARVDIQTDGDEYATVSAGLNLVSSDDSASPFKIIQVISSGTGLKGAIVRFQFGTDNAVEECEPGIAKNSNHKVTLVEDWNAGETIDVDINGVTKSVKNMTATNFVSGDVVPVLVFNDCSIVPLCCPLSSGVCSGTSFVDFGDDFSSGIVNGFFENDNGWFFAHDGLVGSSPTTVWEITGGAAYFDHDGFGVGTPPPSRGYVRRGGALEIKTGTTFRFGFTVQNYTSLTNYSIALKKDSIVIAKLFQDSSGSTFSTNAESDTDTTVAAAGTHLEILITITETGEVDANTTPVDYTAEFFADGVSLGSLDDSSSQGWCNLLIEAEAFADEFRWTSFEMEVTGDR